MPGCGEIGTGLAPDGVTGRVQYGPLVHAKAALATCAHYLPFPGPPAWSPG